MSVPFDDTVLQHGVLVAMAEKLFKSGDLSLGKAAKMSLHAFTEHVSQLGIPVVNYDPAELETELEYFDS